MALAVVVDHPIVYGKVPSMMVMIDKAGRVVIPKDARDRLSLTPDAELEVVVEGDSIRLVPQRVAGRRFRIVDGFPRIEAVEGMGITDADVQAWRDADQR
ncbi:MAG: AbrB/MazE/SpoVT family DNA-binding domain-containing protein [Nevskiaceae bacterium]|jgi:AbrB family looped-hinge helix DNA binding protein|nr:AbrB/MazE/SpoVT family DNA-binding domain-containing protein [Nevskiaceae bacterium]